MKSLLNPVFYLNHQTTPSFDVRSLLVICCIVLGVLVAICAMTVDPNNAAVTIGFPP
jgi:hypothetical protein